MKILSGRAYLLFLIFSLPFVGCIEKKESAAPAPASSTETSGSSSLAPISTNNSFQRAPATAFNCDRGVVENQCAFFDQSGNIVEGACGLDASPAPLLRADIQKLKDFHPHAVVVVPKENVTNTVIEVYLPDGTLLDISKSKTSGLQEAIDYANNGGWDLFVYGKGKYANSPNYYLDAPLIMPPLQGKVMRFYNVNLIFSEKVTRDAIVFDSIMMLDFALFGTVYAEHAENAIAFIGKTPHPLDGFIFKSIGFLDSIMYIGQVVGRNALWFDVQKHPNNTVTYVFDHVCGNVAYTGPIEAQLWSRILISPEKSPFIPPKYLDVFNPGAVVMNPPEAEISSGIQGKVYDVDGTMLPDTANNLQFAIDKAINEGKDLVVFGRGLQANKIVANGDDVTYPTTGFFQANSQLLIQGASGIDMTFFNLTLNFAPFPGVAWVVDSIQNSRLEFSGQVVFYNPEAEYTMKFSSTQGDMVNNNISILTVATSGTGYLFDPATNLIDRNKFFTQEVNVQKDGFEILASSDFDDDNEPFFTNNDFVFADIHHVMENGAFIGREGAEDGLLSNSIYMDLRNTKRGKVGAEIYGKSNVLIMHTKNMSGLPAYEENIVSSPESFNSLSLREILGPVKD